MKRGRPRKERYARLMGGFWRNTKIRRLSLEARGLLATAWSYASDQNTDGKIPVELLQAWGGKRYPKLMAELTRGTDNDGDRPLLVLAEGDIDARANGWSDVNISVEAWERKLESDRNRKPRKGDFPTGKGTGKSSDFPTGNVPHFQGGALDEDEDEDEESLRETEPAAGVRATAGPLAVREALLARLLARLHAGWGRRYLERTAQPSPPAHHTALRPVATWCAEYLASRPDEDPDALADRLLAGFFGRPDLKRPKPEWLAEDPGRYVTGTDSRTPPAPKRRTDRLPPGTGEGFSDDDIPADLPPREVRYG